MSKSKILKKILAVGLSIMSCIPAVGANGSNNEEPPKVQIKNESKDNSRPVSIKKTIAVETFVTVLTLLSGYGGIKLSDYLNAEKQYDEEPKMKKIDRELWEKLDELVVLCGQKKIREYIESQPDTIPYVRDLKYMFRVLRGKEKCDEERFKCILNRLRYWYDYYSFDSVERVRKDMDALTYSCPIDVDDKPGPISERMRFYVRDSADKLSGKDGFTLSCFADGNISEEFEKFFFNGKEYELTVCEFGRVIKWNDVVIKQENGEWCRYNIDGKCEVISKEKLKTMLNNSIFIGSIKHSGLTYSVK